MSETTATSTANKIMTTLSSTTVSMTSSMNTTLSPSPSNTTESTANDGGRGMSQAENVAIAIVITLVFLVIILIVLFFLLKKLGKLPKFCNSSYRKRRSSTSSSRRALDEESCGDGDTSSMHRPNEKLKKNTEEMFTIEDFEEEDANDREREEYFYDEVFGTSEFEDETTKNSVRQLFSADSGESPNLDIDDGGDEMLDFDFETLGIRADGYSQQAAANRKVTI